MIEERQYIPESPLTLHERGVSGKPTAYDRLMDSPQWKAAKNLKNPQTGFEYTPEERVDGANFIVSQLWTDRQTTELQKRLRGDVPVFVTMPSTTGYNLLPKALSLVLQSRLGGEIISGDEVTQTIHAMAMKDVPAEERPFVPREYVLLDPERFKQSVVGKEVVVVEDVLSSGASAKAFCDTLSESKIQVSTVAGLLGDSRLVAEPQMVQKLSKALKRSDIALKAKDIAAVLSRGQVDTLIDVLNTRGKNEQGTITEGIQRVLNSRIARHMGQDSWRGTQGGAGRVATNDGGRQEHGAGVSVERGGPGGRRDHQNGRDQGVDELTRKKMEAERRRRFEEREAAKQAKRGDKGQGMGQ